MVFRSARLPSISLDSILAGTDFVRRSEGSRSEIQLKSLKQALQSSILAGEIEVVDDRELSKIPRGEIKELRLRPTDKLREYMHAKLIEWIKKRK